MGITFLLDITMIIILSIYYIIKKEFNLMIKLFVNEVLDIILFMFLLYKLTYYYLLFYWTYKSLKFFVNNKLPKIKSILSVLTYIDSLLISSIEINKLKISNKLQILTKNC
jgi:Kef-type K+ transport system membrane component KefB